MPTETLLTRIREGQAIDMMRDISDGSVDLVYLDPPFFTGHDKGDFDDRWPSLQSYLMWLENHVMASYEVLRSGGNFILHLDWHAVHAAKVSTDRIFKDGFVNEIIWNYASGGASTRRLSRKHDNLLWYVKGGERAPYTFNTMREPYATPDVEGRPGFHPDGRVLTDVWNISILSTTAKERTGYATQKPLALMDRIVRLFSNREDFVLDPMCGSGTTGVAATLAGRNSVLIDKNPEAIKITRQRMDTARVSWAING